MKTTNYQFKILYAVGMICIVATHYANGGINFFRDWFAPTAYLVQMFFFCSGYFYNKDSEMKLGRYVWNKFKRLIIPLYLWNIFYGIISNLLKIVGFTYAEDISFYTLFISPIYDGHQFGFNLASWCLYPLFMSQVFVAAVRKLLRKIKVTNEVVIFVCFMVVGMLCICPAIGGYYEGWWRALARFGWMMPFYAMGQLYKGVLEEKVNRISSFPYFTVVFVAQALLLAIYKGIITYTPSRCDTFDNCVTPYLIGVIGIAFWLRVAKILEPAIGKSKIVLAIADNSFAIMMHQFFGFFVIKCGFALLAYLGIACSSFDMAAFKSSVTYGYLPIGMHQFAFFILVGCIAFCIYFGKLGDYLAAKVWGSVKRIVNKKRLL